MTFRKLVPPTAAVIAAAGVIALLAIAVVQSVTIRDQSSIIATLSENNDLLRDQVDELGEIPVAPPAEAVVGAQGDAGPAGVDGVSVVRVTCGSDGTWTVLYSNGRAQTEIGPCTAEDGADGQNGQDGAPGPAGPAGAPGNNGSDGEPPTSWTFTWLGVEYSCTRTTPFDPAAPTYQCTTV